MNASTATAVPQYFIVGDNSDSRCQFATIQQALQAALANGPGLDYVMLTNTATYTNTAVQVGAQSVLIEGGYANCDLDPDGGQPFADLVGNGSDPVIRIEPIASGTHDVRLSGLRIRGGGRNDANGGGVRMATAPGATVLLTIRNSEITANRALSGGGVHAARGSGNAAGFALTLEPGTRIHDNTAASNGGGLNLWGGNTFIAADGVRIDHNSAAGAGGGIATLSGTFIAVGNPNIETWPARNDVTGARIESNTAGTSGGGLYLSGIDSVMEARELIVDDNRAGFGGGGGAVASGASFSMLRDTPNAFGWYCPPALECTRLSNNRVADGITLDANGGALAVYGSASAWLIQTLVRDNAAQDGSAVFINGAGIVNTEGSVFSGNRSYDPTGGLSATIRSRYTPPSAAPKLRLAYSTLVENKRLDANSSLQPGLVLLAQSTDLRVYSSALFDGNTIMDSAGISDCAVLGPDSGLPAGSNTRLSFATQAPARIFLAPARKDWRPRFDSPLTDVCDASQHAPSYSDRDLNSRCRNDARPDNWGTCEAGAWENDQLFANGFD
ncbi:MAG: hypothetical protein J0L88_06435 [Xanthomonadales bacterium]|nr:hypothetical protein [Xanthomonadales bacterium]